MEEEISLPENKGKSSAEELKEYASIPLKYKLDLLWHRAFTNSKI